MKAQEIFGKHLRDMMSYVGRQIQSNSTDNMPDLGADVYIIKAHAFLSQPMEESWFVRGSLVL